MVLYPKGLGVAQVSLLRIFPSVECGLGIFIGHPLPRRFGSPAGTRWRIVKALKQPMPCGVVCALERALELLREPQNKMLSQAD